MSETDVKVIALVGMPGSGKGTCTDYLGETYSWPVIHFGNMVYEEVQRRGLDNVRDEIFVREDMRAQEGKAVLAKHVARKTHEYAANGAPVVVLDGLYSWSELLYLREEFGDSLSVVAVAAPRKLRYQRILNRQDSHRKYTSEQQIINREVAEIENLEKGGPIAQADYTIVNEQATADMTGKLDEIIAELGLNR
jgi:dephospho-CoA kinase